MVKMNISSVITTVVVEIPTISEYQKVPGKQEQTRCTAWIAVDDLATFAAHTHYDADKETIRIDVDKTICPLLDRGRTSIELKTSNVDLNPWEFSRGKSISLWIVAALLMGGITTSVTLNEPKKLLSYLGIVGVDDIIPNLASCGRLKARYFHIIADYICDQLASKRSLGAERLISYINLQMNRMDGDVFVSTQSYPKVASSRSEGVVPAAANDTNPEISTR
jgi:hypothetical protein